MHTIHLGFSKKPSMNDRREAEWKRGEWVRKMKEWGGMVHFKDDMKWDRKEGKNIKICRGGWSREGGGEDGTEDNDGMKRKTRRGRGWDRAESSNASLCDLEWELFSSLITRSILTLSFYLCLCLYFSHYIFLYIFMSVSAFLYICPCICLPVLFSISSKWFLKNIKNDNNALSSYMKTAAAIITKHMIKKETDTDQRTLLIWTN